MTVAIYARVSTQRQAQAQTIEQQLDRLHAHLRERGVELASGFLLVGMGLLIFSDRLSLISVWLTTVFGNGLAA